MPVFEFIALFLIMSAALATIAIGFADMWRDVASWRETRVSQSKKRTLDPAPETQFTCQMSFNRA